MRSFEANTAKPPEVLVIPDHELLRCIGRGSSGEVWLARTVMGAYRAVKLLHRQDHPDGGSFEREISGIQKFEPVSRSHDGLVDVLQVGRAGEHFYYIMEVGDDLHAGPEIDPDTYTPKTLARELAERGRVRVSECVQWGLCLTEALSHLHERGLLHRDIKPSNIIFVNGSPKLADIGLVADIKSANSFVGTHGFIPPEGPGSAHADIYSLGKVLYEISTGRDRTDFPNFPEKMDELPDAKEFLELNEVLLRACHNDKRLRYQSAKDMHADLVVLLNGKSVKRLRWLERQWAIAKRVGVAALLAVMLFGSIYTPVARARRVAAEARHRQVGGLIAEGVHAMDSGNYLSALPSFVEALRLDNRNPQREQAHRLRLDMLLQHLPKIVHMWFRQGQMNYAEFSPDGETVLAAQWFNKAEIWNLKTGHGLLPPFGPSGGLEMASYSPDGKWVVTASHDETVRIWEAASGEQKIRLAHPAGVYCARFTPDGRYVLSTCEDGKVRLWDISTEQIFWEVAEHTNAVTHGSFSRNGRFVVTASKDGTARVWDTATGRPAGPVLQHKGWVYHASFSPDGRRIVTSGSDRKARVWDAATGRLILPTLNHGDMVRSAEFSPDGRLMLTASLDSTVRLWDADTQQPLNPNPILHHSARVMHAGFHSDGHQIVSVCVDGTVRVWDLAAGAVLPQSIPDTPAQEDGEAAAFSSSMALTQAVTKAVLSPSGRLLIAATGSTLHFWDVATKKTLWPPCKLESQISHVQFSPDGRRFLTCCVDNVLNERGAQVWDATTGQKIGSALRHRDGVLHGSFSPDGRRVVTASEDFSAIVWDAETGRQLTPPLLHEGLVQEASFSDDGQWIVTASADKTARIWDAQTGHPLAPPLRHFTRLRSARFLPGGKGIITSTRRGQAWVWDLSGDPLPVEDLTLFAQLLRGMSTYDHSRPGKSGPHLREIWSSLSTRYPEQFITQADELVAWHRNNAEISEDNGAWHAAPFHWQRLMALKPNDQALSERLARAQQELAK